MDIWKEELALRFANVDRSERLTLGAAFEFFQEAAISHASVLGVGREDLTESGQAWVLSRISVFIEERPKYGETLTVRSWPRGPDKLLFLRDYDIADSSGKTLVRGRSGWMVLDVERRRPIRLQAIAEKLPLNDGVNALLSGPLGLSARENLAPVGSRQAAYSDIDSYGHVNNVRYVQWIQDLTSHEALDNARQMRLDINYMSETRPGEKVEFFSVPIDSGDAVADYPASPSSAFAYEGRRQDGQISFRAELRLGS